VVRMSETTIPLLSQEQAADRLRVKPTTLAAWRHFGRGPVFLKIGRSCFYRMSDIEDWLNKQVIIPGAGVRQSSLLR
jgi:hypothetical protein